MQEDAAAVKEGADSLVTAYYFRRCSWYYSDSSLLQEDSAAEAVKEAAGIKVTTY